MRPSEGPFGAAWEDNDAMVSWHDREGRYVHASKGAQHVIGWPAKEIIGRIPYALLHPADIPVIAAYHEGLWDGTYAGAAVVFRLKGRDNAYRWIRTETEVFEAKGKKYTVSLSRIETQRDEAVILDRQDRVVLRIGSR